MITAVVFDLDGVLIDSESRWAEERRSFTLAHGGRYPAEATGAMQGMSSPEWSAYMRDELGVGLAPPEISDGVVTRMLAGYDEDLPLLPGADATVRRLAGALTLGMASSANRPIIDAVLAAAGWGDLFVATVSSEEVMRGKPAGDVYLEAARRLGLEPERCAAVEDSHNGLLSARAAGMRVIAVPNPHFPPPPDALAVADRVLRCLAELTPEAVRG